jgi:hypothetical protein
VSKCVWLVENDENPRAFVFFIRGGKRREREKRVIEGERERRLVFAKVSPFTFYSLRQCVSRKTETPFAHKRRGGLEIIYI